MTLARTLALYGCLPALTLALGLSIGPVHAAAPPASGLPEFGEEEPEVRIIQRDRDVIEEYRIQGRLYMIRVVPRRGVPYYLVDTDGDGNLETRRNEMTEDLLVPNWTLFRW